MFGTKIKDTFAFALIGSAALAASRGLANAYCAAQGQVTSYEWIDAFAVGGVTSSTGNNNGYLEVSNPSFALDAGGSYGLTLSAGYGWGSYSERWAVWIDLDQNGAFDGYELLYQGSGHGTLSGTLDIPADALAGETTLRVAMRYGSSPSACGTFTYGEVEDYDVTLTAAGPVATTTTVGFDAPIDERLVVIGNFIRNGVATNSYNFFYPGGAPQRQVTLDADAGTEIGWTAVIYPAYGEDLAPVACSTEEGSVCFTAAGAVGETVTFSTDTLWTPPDNDQVIDFEDAFGGSSYAPGPSVDIDGVTFTTTAPYFYNPTGGPFGSDYLGFGGGTHELTFSAPASSISFDAAGGCTNCTQTVTVTADGVPVDTFDVDYGVITPVTVSLPSGTMTVGFDRNFKIDDLAIDYE